MRSNGPEYYAVIQRDFPSGAFTAYYKRQFNPETGVHFGEEFLMRILDYRFHEIYGRMSHTPDIPGWLT